MTGQVASMTMAHLAHNHVGEIGCLLINALMIRIHFGTFDLPSPPNLLVADPTS